MAEPGVPAEQVAALDRIRDRQEALRAAIAASPMGQHLARREEVTARMQDALDELTSRRLAGALAAVLRDDGDAARELLADLDPDEVAAMATAAETLAQVAWGVVRGQR